MEVRSLFGPQRMGCVVDEPEQGKNEVRRHGVRLKRHDDLT